MTSDQFKDMKDDLSECCYKSCNCTSEFVSNYPILSTLIASGVVLSAATLVSPKARKVLFPAFKYLGKQQLKLFAGIGILSVATYLANESIDVVDNVNNLKESVENEDEIILNDFIK